MWKRAVSALCLGLTAVGLLFLLSQPSKSKQQTHVLMADEDVHRQQTFLQQQIPQHLVLQHSVLQQQQHAVVDKDVSRENSVFFMKTHKTASSAVQNIFLRRALTDHLTIPIGRYDWARLCYSRLYSRSCPQNNKDAPFDMIIQHLRYNPEEVKASLKSDAVYVTILRHPDTLIPSAYKYFEWDSTYTTLDSFAQAYPRLADTVQNDVPYRNLMLYDFGLEPAKFSDDKLVDSLISHVKDTFHVVMFQERLSESLVLLRHALGWSLEDVVVFSINKQSSHVQAVSNTTRDLIRRWNSQDLRLYDALYEQFNRTVLDFGIERMSEEVFQLETLTEQVFRKCVRSITTEEGKFGKLTKFVLTPEGQANSLCMYLTSSELDLLEQLKNRLLHGV